MEVYMGINNVEALNYGMILPPKESIMFFMGCEYETGSDYHKEELLMSLEDHVEGVCIL